MSNDNNCEEFECYFAGACENCLLWCVGSNVAAVDSCGFGFCLGSSYVLAQRSYLSCCEAFAKKKQYSGCVS
eukprot:snap_masked-scaffold_31-processed-gene-3.19-mRNA-1 protein AED:1.00 eAED:1.00 QI:0/0/0/0/1/1/2/0/71